MDAWEVGGVGMLEEDTVRTHVQCLSTIRGEGSTEHQAKIFHILVLSGKLRLFIQWITDRDKGRVFHPGGICLKTGKPVIDVLRLKHPGARLPTMVSFKAYGDQPPAFMSVEITNETVASVAK